jgi:hypothetical protein
VIGIAFDLDRSTLAAGDQDAGREAILDERGRIVQRDAGRDLGRLMAVRQDLARRPRRARGETGSGGARAREPEERPAAELVEPDRPGIAGVVHGFARIAHVITGDRSSSG